MGDYISREAVCYQLAKQATTDGQPRAIRRAAKIVADFPAANVRPVVLCRDCAYCRKGKASLECEKHTYAWNNLNRWVDEDDFCSWGVKREER